jgi:peroxin-3
MFYSLRRRFEQNQQDASYMTMGLMPTLASQILDGMDVEALTAELQSKVKPRAPRSLPTDPVLPPIEMQMPQAAPSSEPEHSTESTSEQENGETTRSRSTSLSMSTSSFSIPDRPGEDSGSGSLTGSSFLDTSLGQSSAGGAGQSWVAEFTGGTSANGNGAHAQSDAEHSRTPSSSAVGSAGRESEAQSQADSLSTSAVSSAIGDSNEVRAHA